MPLPEPRNCAYSKCRAPLDPSRPANTLYCNSDCRHLAFEERSARKQKRRRRGARAPTSYVVFEQIHGADVQTLRLVGFTSAGRREEAAGKLREYARNGELIAIPSRSLRTISPA